MVVAGSNPNENAIFIVEPDPGDFPWPANIPGGTWTFNDPIKPTRLFEKTLMLGCNESATQGSLPSRVALSLQCGHQYWFHAIASLLPSSHLEALYDLGHFDRVG